MDYHGDPIELGREYEYIVAGMMGIATGLTTYLTGCDRVILQPAATDDGKMPDSYFVDDAYCRLVEDGRRVPVFSELGESSPPLVSSSSVDPVGGPGPAKRKPGGPPSRAS